MRNNNNKCNELLFIRVFLFYKHYFTLVYFVLKRLFFTAGRAVVDTTICIFSDFGRGYGIYETVIDLNFKYSYKFESKIYILYVEICNLYPNDDSNMCIIYRYTY